jgi:hypothetical protein
MDDLNVRDLFAMMAMCGMVANKGLAIEADLYAKISYKMANAMMDEKEKQDEQAR